MGNSKCTICGRNVQELQGGIFSGNDLMSLVSNSPYPCKRCGAVYCQDCMSEIRNLPCKFCRQPHGWEE